MGLGEDMPDVAMRSAGLASSDNTAERRFASVKMTVNHSAQQHISPARDAEAAGSTCQEVDKVDEVDEVEEMLARRYQSRKSAAAGHTEPVRMKGSVDQVSHHRTFSGVTSDMRRLTLHDEAQRSLQKVKWRIAPTPSQASVASTISAQAAPHSIAESALIQHTTSAPAALMSSARMIGTSGSMPGDCTEIVANSPVAP